MASASNDKEKMPSEDDHQDPSWRRRSRVKPRKKK
jgi:hypothetical protein